jgi:hypothetical protein
MSLKERKRQELGWLLCGLICGRSLAGSGRGFGFGFGFDFGFGSDFDFWF